MGIGGGTTPETYPLGTSEAELRHLVEQAATYTEETDALFDLVGIAPGTAAIDVGCGVLGVLHVLAGRVGAGGRVVGLDREPAMVQAARRLAAERGLQVEVLQGDAVATGLPDDGFDVVHARSVLLNVSTPERVLAEMVRIARPGGVVVVQEPDSASWNCDPPHEAFDVLHHAVRDAYRRTGKDLDIGRRSGRLLREAGLEDVDVRATIRVTRQGEYFQSFLLTIADLVRDEILAGGGLTAEALDARSGALRAHLDTSGTVTLQPVMWQAWGRKPATDAVDT